VHSQLPFNIIVGVIATASVFKSKRIIDHIIHSDEFVLMSYVFSLSDVNDVCKLVARLVEFPIKSSKGVVS